MPAETAVKNDIIQSMKRLVIIPVYLFVLTFSSCTQNINIRKYINLKFPFILTLNSINTNTNLTEWQKFYIEPKSEEFEKLIKWFDNNSDGWEIASDSYSPKYSITQNNFNLLRLNNAVVLNVVESNGESKQYMKSVSNDELNFLIKK